MLWNISTQPEAGQGTKGDAASTRTRVQRQRRLRAFHFPSSTLETRGHKYFPTSSIRNPQRKILNVVPPPRGRLSLWPRMLLCPSSRDHFFLTVPVRIPRTEKVGHSQGTRLGHGSAEGATLVHVLCCQRWLSPLPGLSLPVVSPEANTTHWRMLTFRLPSPVPSSVPWFSIPSRPQFPT